MRKLSLLGLILIAASAVTAAVLPNNEPKKTGIGDLVQSGDDPNTMTCTEDQSPAVQCEWTDSVNEASSTTTGGNDTSTQTSAGDIETNTDVAPPLQNTSGAY